jgi:hypothetical protein
MCLRALAPVVDGGNRASLLIPIHERRFLRTCFPCIGGSPESLVWLGLFKICSKFVQN